MKHIYNWLLLLLYAILLMACNKELDRRVERGLQFAGENRKELEKVLEHYKKEPEKLQAARFLIANMPNYHSYTSWEVDSLKSIIKSAIPLKGFILKDIKEKWKGVYFQKDSKIYDSHIITSKLLIENIDLSFEIWQNRPWSKRYTFDDFCEYILPYRIENEPLENWRKMYYERYAPVLDSLYKGNDVVEAAKVIVTYLKNEGFASNHDFILPHLGASFLFENRIGSCLENCDITTYVLRALGIPVATDYYQISPVFQSRHYWSALIDTTGLPVPFNYTEEEMTRGYYGKRKAGKVFRRMFGVQPERYSGLYTNSTVPALFSDPFIKDVSNGYFRNTIEVTIPAKNKKENQFMYLAIWTGRNYEAIDIGKIKRGKVTFKGLEMGIIYHPVYFNHENVKAAYYPFLLSKDSLAHFFIPDKTRLISKEIYRKYPMHGNIRGYLNNMKYTTIEADNRLDFKNAHLIYYVKDTPVINYNKIVLKKTVRYRYIRLSPRYSRRIQLAEFGVYSDTLAQKRFYPETIIPDTVIDKAQLEQTSWTIDDDWVSYYNAQTRGKPLIYDFGKPVEINSIVYIPRNDDNFIRIGDMYELFYQDGIEGWISLGKQKANTYYLIYNNVPDNTVLWLCNHTRGKEERVFYYKDKEQIFP